jgi:hypothetical protein
MAMFNVLVQWNGLEIDDDGAVHFHLAPCIKYSHMVVKKGVPTTIPVTQKV